MGIFSNLQHVKKARKCGGVRWSAKRHAAKMLQMGIKSLPAWLAVELVIRDDPPTGDAHEFKLVQAAKVVHRIGGGSHKRWGHELRDGRDVWATELHVFPRSRGWVLRHMGADLEKAMGGLAEYYLRCKPQDQ